MNKKMNIIDIIALLLVIIGSINWGLVGVFQFNLVSFLFAKMADVQRVIYGVVGIAGIWILIWGLRCCCKANCGTCPSSETEKS